MKKLLLLTSISAIALASSTYAVAAPSLSSAASNGFYANLSGGVNLGTAINESGEEIGTYAFSTGWNADLGAGYRIDSFRLEGDLGFLSNPIAALSSTEKAEIEKDAREEGFTDPSVKSVGSANVLSFMANAFYDINTGSSFTPFVGAGIGAGRLNLNGIGANTSAVLGGKNITLDHTLEDTTATQFAYDAQLGLAYKISQNMSLNIRYQYFATVQGNIQGKSVETQNIDGSKTTLSTEKLSTKLGYHANLVNAGLTYLF